MLVRNVKRKCTSGLSTRNAHFRSLGRKLVINKFTCVLLLGTLLFIVLFYTALHSENETPFYRHAHKNNPHHALTLSNGNSTYHKGVVFSPGASMKSDPYKLICYHFNQRLEDQLFQYASVLGLALTLNRRAVFMNTDIMDKVLKSPVQHTIKNERQWAARCAVASKVKEKTCCKFDERLTKLSFKHDYWIHGNLQSWKYFIQSEDQIVKALKFSDLVWYESTEILNHLKNITFGSTLIGVYIRRRDFVPENGQNESIASAALEYLKRSFAYFRDRSPGCVFVISGDDLKWCKVMPGGFKVIFLEDLSPEVIMATLSRLDHTVTTFGSFSWWCGYFNSGIVVYMKNLLALHSHLGETDFVYPRWFAL